MSEQFNGGVTAEELAGCVTSTGLSYNEPDLAFLKDFLVTLQGCNVARFSGYGISVDFNLEVGGFDIARAPVGAGTAVPLEPSGVSRIDKPDGWRNPGLWPQQNGRVLKFDGSFE